MTYVIDPVRFESGVSSLLTDLMSWWTLDETSGTRYDAHGSVDLTDTNTVGYATGKQSNAADYVAANSETLQSASDDAFKFGDEDFSACAWVNVDALGAGYVFVCQGPNSLAPSNDNLQWFLFKNPSNNFSFYINDSGSVNGIIDTGTTASTGTWYFLYGQYDSVNKEIGVSVNNGSLVTKSITQIALTAVTHPTYNFGKFCIGSEDPQVTARYTDGKIDEVAIWGRLLTATELTTLYNSGSGITYNDIASGSWSYNSLASAEASGDSWVDGDTVKILGGATFLYKSALATNGHSGLVHKDPFNESGTLSSVTLITAEGPGTDPDTWISGGDWVDGGSGTKGVDYDHLVSGAYSQLTELSASGRALVRNNPSVATENTVALILRQIYGTNTTVASSATAFVYCVCYRDGSNLDRIILDVNGNTDEWEALIPADGTLGLAAATPRDLWVYCKQGKYAVWNNADATPTKTGTAGTSASAAAFNALLSAGDPAVDYGSDTYVKTVVCAGFAT